MIASRNIGRAFLLLIATASLAGCWESKNPGYQGWVEADMIFVSPDEQDVSSSSMFAEIMSRWCAALCGG
jgi:hypothetical protein